MSKMRILLFFLIIFIPTMGNGYIYQSPKEYSLEVPNSFFVINKTNYYKYKEKIPSSLYRSFEQGNDKELFVEDLNRMSESFFIVESVRNGFKYIDVEKTCEQYEKIDGDNLVMCEGRRIRLRDSLIAVTYNGPGQTSYIRLWIEMKQQHLLVVSIGRWDSEYLLRRSLYGMIDMLKTLKE